jgi:hypothetical protein
MPTSINPVHRSLPAHLLHLLSGINAGVRVPASRRLKLFRLIQLPRPLLGPRREDIVGLYGTIHDALPAHLAEQFWSLDTSNGIRVTLRSGQTFWFLSNTTVKAIVARIMEETSRCAR